MNIVTITHRKKCLRHHFLVSWTREYECFSYVVFTQWLNMYCLNIKHFSLWNGFIREIARSQTPLSFPLLSEESPWGFLLNRGSFVPVGEWGKEWGEGKNRFRMQHSDVYSVFMGSWITSFYLSFCLFLAFGFLSLFCFVLILQTCFVSDVSTTWIFHQTAVLIWIKKCKIMLSKLEKSVVL